MDQNHIRINGTATDEPAPSINPEGASPGPEPFAFASQAEANAYWAGVSDGLRNGGNLPCPRLAARARDEYPELVSTAGERRDQDILDFDPVSVRHRVDGWTPARQREYVEALADSGVARYAAARVGMSEQSVSRLRRRRDARSFDLACEAAHRFGARRIRSVAFERGIEGTIKRHYYRGELKSEERVFDNRLLIYLLGKTEHLLAPSSEAQAVADNWEPWMEAIEQGLPAPPVPEPEAPKAPPLPPAVAAAAERANCDVWESDGELRTNFPPPADFDGYEEGKPGEEDYERDLSDDELRAVAERLAAERAEQVATERAARDRFFGFAGGAREDDLPSQGTCT